MKSSCYFVFSHSVLLCPNLYSINLHNSLKTCSILILVLSTAETSWTPQAYCLLAVLLQLTAILRPLTTQLRNSAHLYRRDMDTDLQKRQHMIASQPVHWCSGWTYRKHVMCFLSTVVVTSLRMRKLHRHKESNAAVLLVMCVLWALSGNGFTCHNIKRNEVDETRSKQGQHTEF
jgi:hypothetical protein